MHSPLYYRDLGSTKFRVLEPHQLLIIGLDPTGDELRLSAERDENAGVRELLASVHERHRRSLVVTPRDPTVSAVQLIVYCAYGNWTVADVGRNRAARQPWGRQAHGILPGLPGERIGSAATVWMPEGHDGRVAFVDPRAAHEEVRLAAERRNRAEPAPSSARPRTRTGTVRVVRLLGGEPLVRTVLVKFGELLRFPAETRYPQPTEIPSARSNRWKTEAAKKYATNLETGTTELRRELGMALSAQALEILIDRQRVTLDAIRRLKVDSTLVEYHPAAAAVHADLARILHVLDSR